MTAGAGSYPSRVARPGLLLAVACAAQFMVTLDVSIVNVALPAIGTDLSMSAGDLQWIVNAYTLCFGGFLLLGGRAADLFGYRRMLLLGLALFTGASVLGGVAPNGPMLIAARAAQGLGGAVLTPATLTILTLTFRDEQARARALGVWAAVLASGGAVGSLLGGVLTAEAGWRWIFLVNVPVGVVVLLVARRAVPAGRAASDVRRRLDVLGAVTATTGLVLVVFAIVQTQAHSWTSRMTVVPLSVGLGMIGAFVLHEGRRAADPIMPLRIFRNRAVTAANLTGVLIGFNLFAMYYFVSLYLQRVLHYGPLRAGLAFVPFTVGIAIGARISSRLAGAISTRTLLGTGAAVWAAGLLWLSRISPVGDYWADVFGPSLLCTIGTGLALVPLTLAATTGVAPGEAGLASGLVNTSRQVGGSLGLAVLATVATAHTDSLLGSGHGLTDATTAGYSRAFVVAAGVALVAAGTALLVPAVRATRGAQPEPVPSTPSPVEA